MKVKELIDTLNYLVNKNPDILEKEVWVETCCNIQLVEQSDRRNPVYIDENRFIIRSGEEICEERYGEDI